MRKKVKNPEYRYSTHLFTLREIFKIIKINTVFEFGCGIYSTKFFIENGCEVISTECSDKNWYNKIKEEIKSEKFKLLYFEDKFGPINYLKEHNEIFDLILIDGEGSTRIDCAIESFNKSPIIVAHDTNVNYMKEFNNRISNRFGYEIFNIMKPKPHTSVFTINLELKNKLENIFKGVILKY